MITILIAALVRPLILAAGGWLLLRALRVRHPASEHAVWTAVLCGVMLVIPVSVLMPHWNLAVLPARAALAAEDTVVHGESPDGVKLGQMLDEARRASAGKRVADPGFAAVGRDARTVVVQSRVEIWIPRVYFAGVLALVLYRMAGWWMLRRVLHRSRRLPMHPLRESSDIVVPVAAGCLRPAVILPRDWREWSRPTREAVLAHEFAHIRRRDALVAAGARAVQCALWFHPLAWWLGAKLGQLAEMACDAEAVARTGDPGGYSRVLLEFAGKVNRAGYRVALPGLAMAGRGGLGRRVDQVFASTSAPLRRLARPAWILAFCGLPVLSLAATLSFTETLARPLLQVKVRPVPVPTPAPVSVAQAAPAPTRVAAASPNAASVRKVFADYCVQCHNQSLAGRRLQLDKMDPANVAADAAAWERVVRALKARTEPPVALPRPNRGTYEATIQWLEHELDKAAAPTSPHLSDAELAGRLATFLWNAAPDDRLQQLAAGGTLHDPKILEAEARRMLADPRSQALVANFFAPWFLRGLDSVQRSQARFPEFDNDLRDAMQRETELFLDSQVREDHAVPDLLTADYTFLNDRLAKLYGIGNVNGSQFRRVVLTGTSRQGLLGQASILTVTALATRNSPTIRAKWVLQNVLGVTPPEPPPSVPMLKDDPQADATVRQRLAAHVANPRCGGCHSLIDPMGFAFEHFNAIGQWQDMDGSQPVDASGVFPDGTTFTGPADFRWALLERRDAFASLAAQKLLSFAMGRKKALEPQDMPAVRTILRQAPDLRWSNVIAEIVKSAPFQERRGE